MEMSQISLAEGTNPDSIYADDNRTSLIEGTRNEQAGRYAEILWLERRLWGPVRAHKEDRLRKALTETEAVYEAQWIELEMAVGSRVSLKVRSQIEVQQGIDTLLFSLLDSRTEGSDCQMTGPGARELAKRGQSDARTNNTARHQRRSTR